jgi:hypothetical protein
MKLALALLLVPSLAFADVTTDELAALKAAARCADRTAPFRPWCVAADFATGAAAELPKRKVLVGITVELAKGKEAAALTDKVSFVALAVDADGKVKLTDVKATNERERQMVGEAVMGVAMLFKGKATTAKMPTDLAGYLKTLKGSYPTTKVGKDWTWTGASSSRMRKVGEAWVIVETPKGDQGIFATVLTEAWE